LFIFYDDSWREKEKPILIYTHSHLYKNVTIKEKGFMVTFLKGEPLLTELEEIS